MRATRRVPSKAVRARARLAALIFGTMVLGSCAPVAALAADICKAIALTDVACDASGCALKKGEIDEAVTQYWINKKTGDAVFCSHGGGCYPRYLTVNGKKVEALRLTNCKIGARYDEDEEYTYYSVDVDRSKVPPQELRVDEVDNRLLELGLCSACAGTAAYLYVNRPDSHCAAVVRQVLEGNPVSLKNLQEDDGSVCPYQAKTVHQPSVYDCDRLAGSPLDPSRAADGVSSDKIDTANAISSCAQAVRDDSTNARFQFEYGRALDAAKRYEEAMRWYRAAADQGYSAAQVGLGFIYYYGRGVPQNYDEAMRWLRKAADQGNAVAENALGVIFINGQGVSQNYNEAMKWYRLAADRGFDMAQTNLGGMYYLGRAVAQNYSEAMKWYRKAADQGNADAQNTVGAMYESGHGVPQDYAEAAVWYRKAADQDNAVAQHNLGVLYRDGHGVAQNYAEAAEWFHKAADHGYAKAQHDLGALYYRGQGVETNLAEAFKWFHKAADQGSPEDQNIVGEMYANGQGVSQSYAEAVRWFRMAADQGYHPAGENLAALSARSGTKPVNAPAPPEAGWNKRGGTQPKLDRDSMICQGYAVAQAQSNTPPPMYGIGMDEFENEAAQFRSNEIAQSAFKSCLRRLGWQYVP